MRMALAAVVALVLTPVPLASQYTPPACVAGQTVFTDVAEDHQFCAWIQQVWRDGLADGCEPGAPGAARFCPDAPLTRGQAAMFLERTLRDRLWASGRPGTEMNGELVGQPFPHEELCEGANGIRYGLSTHFTTWHDAAEACPTGTWVCTIADLGLDDKPACDSLRADDNCDWLQCDGLSCENFFSTSTHGGWVSDALTGGTIEGGGRIVYEGDNFAQSATGCAYLPVWCCRN